MPIDKQLLRQLLATEKFKKCADSPDSAAELGSTLSDTESLVRSCQNVQAIPFILWNDFYNSAGILAPKSKKKSYRYKWGDKVFVDFGCGNIQTELSFPHPAIVLYNFANTVIVAPTTSDDSPNSFSADIEEPKETAPYFRKTRSSISIKSNPYTKTVSSAICAAM